MPRTTYVAAIDQGTTSTRCMLFDHDANVVASDQKELKVDDGMVYNDMLMQFQSDILGVPVIRPRVAETTALGSNARRRAVDRRLGEWPHDYPPAYKVK